MKRTRKLEIHMDAYGVYEDLAGKSVLRFLPKGSCAVTMRDWERIMSNTFGRDILIQAEDPMEAASFYVKELGFEITSKTSNMVSLHGTNINLFIERGPTLGPVLEVTVESVQKAKENLKKKGCEIIKDEPEFPRCYVKDLNGLIYNLTE